MSFSFFVLPDTFPLLPCFPLARYEVEDLLRAQMDKDDMAALSFLAEHGFVSAVIISRLQLSRSRIKEAVDRGEQVKLTSIQGATRFEAHFRWRPAAARCQQGDCQSECSCVHVLERDGLNERGELGSGAVIFLAELARITGPVKQKSCRGGRIAT